MTENPDPLKLIAWQEKIAYELATELRVAVTSAVNSIAADLPPLSWKIDLSGNLSGMAPSVDYSENEVPGALNLWVQRFGFTEENGMTGTLNFVGSFGDGRKAEVWGVVDRDAFESAAGHRTLAPVTTSTKRK